MIYGILIIEYNISGKSHLKTSRNNKKSERGKRVSINAKPLKMEITCRLRSEIWKIQDRDWKNTLSDRGYNQSVKGEGAEVGDRKFLLIKGVQKG